MVRPSLNLSKWSCSTTWSLSVVHRPVGMTSPGSWLGMQILSDLLNHGLHFNKVLRWFGCTLKFENLCPKSACYVSCWLNKKRRKWLLSVQGQETTWSDENCTLREGIKVSISINQPYSNSECSFSRFCTDIAALAKAPKITSLQTSKMCMYILCCTIKTEANASGLSNRAITRLGFACDTLNVCF